jgi:hypothetical protein
LSRKRIIGLIFAIIGTIAYEILLFGYLFSNTKERSSFSVLFTYMFSLLGATPVALILAWIGGEARRYGDVEESSRK